MVGEGATLTKDQRAFLIPVTRDTADIASVKMMESERIMSRDCMESLLGADVFFLLRPNLILGNIVFKSFAQVASHCPPVARGKSSALRSRLIIGIKVIEYSG